MKAGWIVKLTIKIKIRGLSEYVARVNLLAMRFLVFALIFSLFISGYSAAAHAFAPVFDGKGQVEIMAFCDGCQPNNTDNGNNEKASDNGCMACHHCCSGHATFPPSTDFNLSMTKQVLMPFLIENLTGDHTFSLLRPPKSLV